MKIRKDREEPDRIGRGQIDRHQEDGDGAGEHERPAPADPFRHPAPEAAGEERQDVAPEYRDGDLGRCPAQLLLQVGAQHGPDRVVDAEVRRHPQTTGEGVPQILALEDREQRKRHLLLGRVLDLLVLRPDFRLFHVEADPDAHQGRQHTQDQHAAPAVTGRNVFERLVKRSRRRAPTARTPVPMSPATRRT